MIEDSESKACQIIFKIKVCFCIAIFLAALNFVLIIYALMTGFSKHPEETNLQEQTECSNIFPEICDACVEKKHALENLHADIRNAYRNDMKADALHIRMKKAEEIYCDDGCREYVGNPKTHEVACASWEM